jgi:hypothetical protein
MNDDLPILKLFQPFREAKAPEGFADRVMARVHDETTPARSWLRSFGFGRAAGRWAWAGGLAMAASVAIMVHHRKTPQPFTNADLPIYLADSSHLEEEANLGTQIEAYFL